MKMGIVILQVRDIAKAKKFYTEIVGLPVDEKQSGPKFVTLTPEGSLLALQDISEEPAGAAKEPGSVEIGFNFDGVDAVWKRWKAAGVEIVLDPETRSFCRCLRQSITPNLRGQPDLLFGPIALSTLSARLVNRIVQLPQSIICFLNLRSFH